MNGTKTWMYKGITVRYSKISSCGRYYPCYRIYDVDGKYYNNITPNKPNKTLVINFIDKCIEEQTSLKERFGCVYGDSFTWTFLQKQAA